MRATISSAHPDGIVAALVLDDETLLVIHPPQSLGPSLVDAPVDISHLAPDLLILALQEPPGLPGKTPDEPMAQVSLIDLEAFKAGHITQASPRQAGNCYALVGNPHNGRVEILDCAQVVSLAATGLVLQLLSGMAAVATRDIDAELEQLSSFEDDENPD